MHALEVDDVLALARRVRQYSPEVFLVVGGHAASAYPSPLRVNDVDAICIDDGERALPLLVDALECGAPPSSVPGFLVQRDGQFQSTGDHAEAFELDDVEFPLRSPFDRWRREYACV